MRIYTLRLAIGLVLMAGGVCVGFASPGMGTSNTEGVDLLKRRIDSFQAQGISMFDALLKLAQEQKLPMGIDHLDREAVEEPISVSVRQITVANALDTILRSRAGYFWRPDNNVINIRSMKAPRGSKNLLDRTIPKFAIPRTNLHEASAALWMDIFAGLHPGVGVTGDFPGKDEVPVGPLRMDNVSVRQVLNELVRASGNSAWTIIVPPRNLDQLPSSGLWTILQYESPPRLYGTEIRHMIWGWGQQ